MELQLSEHKGREIGRDHIVQDSVDNDKGFRIYSDRETLRRKFLLSELFFFYEKISLVCEGQTTGRQKQQEASQEILIVEGKDEYRYDYYDDSGEGYEFKFSIHLQMELSGFSLALQMKVREGE